MCPLLHSGSDYRAPLPCGIEASDGVGMGYNGEKHIILRNLQTMANKVLLRVLSKFGNFLPSLLDDLWAWKISCHGYYFQSGKSLKMLVQI